MKRTGIFFPHMQGERLRDFPQALEGIVGRKNVLYYDARCSHQDGIFLIPEELLAEVHSKEMIEQVKQCRDFEGALCFEDALWSASGTVQATELILENRIDNAFVFTRYGDHHAGRNLYGGGCYLNSAAIAIANARRKYGVNRFAIVDTDPHHGDGSWDLFEQDQDVLYICFCVMAPKINQNKNNNVEVCIPWNLKYQDYLTLVKSELDAIREYKPELIFWNFGYDGTQGDYGDIGISKGCHQKLAKMLKETADETCDGRLVTVLCGGGKRRLATYIIPRIISTLAEIKHKK